MLEFAEDDRSRETYRHERADDVQHDIGRSPKQEASLPPQYVAQSSRKQLKAALPSTPHSVFDSRGSHPDEHIRCHCPLDICFGDAEVSLDHGEVERDLEVSSGLSSASISEPVAYTVALSSLLTCAAHRTPIDIAKIARRPFGR